MDAVDVNDGEWTATAFGVCARVLKRVSELEVVAGLSKATILKKCTSPYLTSVRLLKRLGGHETTFIW